MNVDCDFPAGNIIVDSIDGDTLHVHQDLRDTDGYWFYFNFRVTGAAGRELTVHFTQGEPLSVLGPAVSYDEGRSWSWLYSEPTDDHGGFSHRVPDHVEAVRFALSVPYTLSDWNAFLARINSPHLREETLCRSRKGRRVPLLRLGNPKSSCGILLSCRHHACEMVGDFVLEGVIERVLQDDDVGRTLRASADWMIVPMADMDGVEDGDQGKNRKPYDHNRDYGEEAIYPEPAAIKQACLDWQEKLRVVLDLHCPYIRGEQDHHVFFSGACNTWDEVLRFGKLLDARTPDGLHLSSAFNVPFGTLWNTSRASLLKHWASELPGTALVSALEIPYAFADGEIVSPDAARQFGQRLACALFDYLQLHGQES